jgi:Ca2+-binding RTX toxin-like protein
MSTSLLRRPARAALLGVLLAFLLGSVATATNTVPRTKIDTVQTVRPTANQLKPPACAGVNLNGIFFGSGVITDNNQPHLVIGSPGIDIMRGGAGDDCILGGDGIDTLRGDGGQDVCIGGPGIDLFVNSCETQIQ